MNSRDDILSKIHVRLVAWLSSSYGMNREDSQDIAQDTIVVLAEKYENLTAEGGALTLAFAIARRKRFEHFRRVSRYQEPPEDFDPADLSADPEQEISRQQWLSWLERTLPKLGPRCLRLLELRLREFTTEQIAGQMNWTENNVLVSEKRCRDKARRFAPDGFRRSKFGPEVARS